MSEGVQEERPRGPKARPRQKYDVMLWDHVAQRFQRHRCSIKIWTVRRVLRKVYGFGYDTVSVIVEQHR